ncbi:MAG: NADH-quinone oxidoreductase subunit C [Elusimicrobia bacterium]|nr:NADH-quinone oxidoreductase subunit C [Elusimicrobiota bacterium]
MNYIKIFDDIEEKYNLKPLSLRIEEKEPDEIYARVGAGDFKPMCLAMHKYLHSPVMSFFAVDERKEKGVFGLLCAFQSIEFKKWVFITTEVPKDNAEFESLSKDIYSAALFEREIYEMFGIVPKNSPDTRRLKLHEEVWPQGNFPLRKDFDSKKIKDSPKSEHKLKEVEGDGVFEVAVGPVHAGLIAPGHFRFSVAGEPVINLEIHLGFTHRGVEKIFENLSLNEAVSLSECVSGDSAFAHSWAFCNSIEKILKINVPENIQYVRAVLLELERMYNHVNDIGGIAVDVGFSFPSAFASLMKESILDLNEKLTESRYLKNVNAIGGVLCDFNDDKKQVLIQNLEMLQKDLNELKKMILSNVSFMDRADSTGILRKNIAEDLGVLGPAGRASGIDKDLRKDFHGIYDKVKFNSIHCLSGDVSARLKIRFDEFEESIKIVKQFLDMIKPFESKKEQLPKIKEGYALGCAEGWRGPVLYWVKIDAEGHIVRCKIVDPSFRNWEGLAFAMPGNIVPDFPLCNKSFDFSYSGNDL